MCCRLTGGCRAGHNQGVGISTRDEGVIDLRLIPPFRSIGGDGHAKGSACEVEEAVAIALAVAMDGCVPLLERQGGLRRWMIWARCLKSC